VTTAPALAVEMCAGDLGATGIVEYPDVRSRPASRARRVIAEHRRQRASGAAPIAWCHRTNHHRIFLARQACARLPRWSSPTTARFYGVTAGANEPRAVAARNRHAQLWRQAASPALRRTVPRSQLDDSRSSRPRERPPHARSRRCGARPACALKPSSNRVDRGAASGMAVANSCYVH
jgi:hypothetical protein